MQKKNVSGSYSKTFSSNVNITTGGQWDVALADFPDIDTTGFAVGSTFNYRIIRLQDDPADNYAGCVGLKQFTFHYEVDRLGSATEFS